MFSRLIKPQSIADRCPVVVESIKAAFIAKWMYNPPGQSKTSNNQESANALYNYVLNAEEQAKKKIPNTSSYEFWKMITKKLTEGLLDALSKTPHVQAILTEDKNNVNNAILSLNLGETFDNNDELHIILQSLEQKFQTDSTDDDIKHKNMVGIINMFNVRGTLYKDNDLFSENLRCIITIRDFLNIYKRQRDRTKSNNPDLKLDMCRPAPSISAPIPTTTSAPIHTTTSTTTSAPIPTTTSTHTSAPIPTTGGNDKIDSNFGLLIVISILLIILYFVMEKPIFIIVLIIVGLGCL